MYESEGKREEKVCVPAPNGSMTDLLRENSCVATDILVMTSRINSHLFGIGNPANEEKEAEPRCFHDELLKQRNMLLASADELCKICARLGI